MIIILRGHSMYHIRFHVGVQNKVNTLKMDNCPHCRITRQSTFTKLAHNLQQLLEQLQHPTTKIQT